MSSLFWMFQFESTSLGLFLACSFPIHILSFWYWTRKPKFLNTFIFICVYANVVNTTKVGLYPCPEDCGMFVQCGNGIPYEKDVSNNKQIKSMQLQSILVTFVFFGIKKYCNFDFDLPSLPSSHHVYLEQARKLGRCNSYIQNLNLNMTHWLAHWMTGGGVRSCYRI